MASAQVAPAAPRQRELFTRFEVLKFLGKGSFGSVYSVQRKADGKVYAVKEADASKMSDEDKQAVANEIRLLASSAHANVVRYYEAFPDGNWLCIIMEFAPCGDLAGYIKKARERHIPFLEEVIWDYFIQMLRGVELLHSKKIIHRDIKPANIFIGRRDVVKIGDLGVAKLLSHGNAQTQIGTPHYMAPEIYKRRQYTFAADVWSLGVTLYEMMQLRVPFEAKSLQELRTKVLSGRTVPLTCNYTSDLKRVVAAMLAVAPEERPTVKELLAMPAVAAWAQKAKLTGPCETVPLLKTIKMPKHMRDLRSKLPVPAYNDEKDAGGIKAVVRL